MHGDVTRVPSDTCRLLNVVDFCLDSSISDFKDIISDLIDEVEVRDLA
jgi:hypothetical protein